MEARCNEHMKRIKNIFQMHLHKAACGGLAVLLLAAALLAAGCAAPEEAGPTPTPIALPTATPEPVPAAGGELVLPMPRNPFVAPDGTPQTPLTVNTEEMKVLYSQVYDTFLRCDGTNKIVPGLAEKWTVDETGRIWTFQLRENVVWHDGEGLLNAEDVRSTVSAIFSYGSESYYAALLQEAVESVEVGENSRTVIFTMKRPGASWLYALLFPVLRAGDEEGALNGTGPYKVVYAGDTVVELEANARWWRQSPFIQTMRFLERESNDVALDSYEAGQLNMVHTSNVSAGKHREEGVTNVTDLYTQNCEAILVNHNNATLRSLQMRQAIAHAIDRGTIISNVYMNKAAVCDVPVPPDSFLYDPNSKIYDFDRAKAGALLDELGWTDRDPEGIRMREGRQLQLTLLVNESTENTYRRNAANMIAAQLAEVGILLEVETAPLALGQEESGYETRLQSGQFDLAMVGFNVERSGNLSPYLSRSGARNYGGYANDILQLLMDNAATAVEEKDMREAQSALQQAFVQELPFIMLGFRQSSLVYSSQIQVVGDIRGTEILRTAYRWYMQTVQE